MKDDRLYKTYEKEIAKDLAEIEKDKKSLDIIEETLLKRNKIKNIDSENYSILK